jgi:hypothetical protein
VYPFSSEIIVKKTKLMNWLLSNLKDSNFNNVKLFISEILNTLTVSSGDNQLYLAKSEGFITLMKVIMVIIYRLII